MASSDTCAENHPEVAPLLEAALHQLAQFSWLCSALAGRNGVESIHWWTGVAALAGDNAAPRMAQRLLVSPDDRRLICEQVFGLEGSEDDVRQLDEWARTAAGPRP